MRGALVKFTFFCSLALLCGCLNGSRYAGEWRSVDGGELRLTIAKVKGLEFTIALSGIVGRSQVMPGFLLSNGALEVGGPSDIYFQYLVSDKDTGRLYLIQATDMRTLSSQVKGGRVAGSQVSGLKYVEFARLKSK